MRKDHPARQKHFWEITQTQLVADPPQHHETHNVRRVLEVIEACPCPLVELPATCTASKALVAQCGPFLPFPCRHRLTVWTSHLPPPRYACLHAAALRHKLGWFLTESWWEHS